MSTLYYDLKHFGSEIRSIRNSLDLTQNDVSKLSGVHVDTLRKIEKGKVVPQQETLDLLSSVLKTDLNKLLLNYRFHDYYAFEELKNRIESKIDRDKFETLSVELEDLKTLLNSTSHPYFISAINQLVLLIESIILNKKYDKPNESLDKLVDAIKITTPKFSLDKYTSYVYNSMELRILMNIALLMNKLESTGKSLEIMEFCMKSVEPNDNIYPKICYNLSYTYHRLAMNEKALEYSILGIDYCNKHRDYNGLNLLYFRKGIAEYLLGYDSYKDSLKKAISFSEILNQYDLRDLLILNCKKFYNIDIQS